MKVVEIFHSIEGEGKRAGELTIFIRLFGCNLKCSYCDTRYGCEGAEYQVLSVEEIVQICTTIGCKNVTLTGGEPLIHPGIEKLLQALVQEGYCINVETNGTKEPIHVPGEKEPWHGKIFYTMDYKCPSSGMESQMSSTAFAKLTAEDVVKFVVGTPEDLRKALEVYEELRPQAQVYFSPVFGEIAPAAIVDFLKEKRLSQCKVQIQMHKVIWDPNERGV